ncbi:hypothetical protein DFR50_15731 [Roseiarcus fermentans]|uniref:Uncharacterized protein n=1 Tax=Roseiarcus fermentans TaxID=1473586 RepID=A0A366EII8_9HYPH|nr:hypothetical protein [Roseiarcus fermentans]RBP01269.1 hypothetical protein DFR50_15731 [Roseiarcus fermentans]
MRIPTIAVAAFLFAPAAAGASETYTVDRWPQDIDTIPCSAWDHYPDGSWALRGSVKLGASVIDNIGFNRGDSSARLLDRKCGKK